MKTGTIHMLFIIHHLWDSGSSNYKGFNDSLAWGMRHSLELNGEELARSFWVGVQHPGTSKAFF